MAIFDPRPTTLAITVMSVLIGVLVIIVAWTKSQKILLLWHILAWIECFCYPFLLNELEVKLEICQQQNKHTVRSVNVRAVEIHWEPNVACEKTDYDKNQLDTQQFGRFPHGNY